MGTSRMQTRRRIVVGALILGLLLWPIAVFAQTATNLVRVELVWDANTETDLAGYVVLWGDASGVYTQSQEVTVPTVVLFIDMAIGQRKYFAVRAFNTAGLQSGVSNEVSVYYSGEGLPRVTTVRVPAVNDD